MPKGLGPTVRGMNAIDNRREARSQAIRRLRKLTIGTAVLGVAATTGFGTLAAATYTGAGHTATVATTTTTTPTTSTRSRGNGGIASAVSGLFGTTTGTAHATTGGS